MPEKIRELLTAYHKLTGATHWASSLSVVPILLEIKALIKEGDVVLLSKAHAVTAYLAVFETLPEKPPTSGPFCSLGMALPFGLGVAMSRPNSTVYVVTGDGEWDEGANHEAFWAMKRLGIKNVQIWVDDNGMQAMKDVVLDQIPRDPQVIRRKTYKGENFMCHYANP